MNAFLPSSALVVAAVAALTAAAAAAGFALQHLAARADERGGARAPLRLAAWGLVAAAVAAADRLAAAEPPGVRMAALIVPALVAMKAVVAVEACAGGLAPLPPLRWLCFALGWPGMQPRLFAGPRRRGLAGAGALARRGLAWMLLGAALLGAAWAAVPQVPLLLCRGSGGESLPSDAAPACSSQEALLATLLLLPGLSLLLHFGALNVLAAFWRRAGFDVHALFRAPLLATRLSEFWGRRWNLAFSEMAATAVYRPLASRAGRGPATTAAFLLSGLLHEMAISLPVRAGYGLPFVYFALQGALVLLERAAERRGWRFPRSGAAGRAWCLLWLGAPLLLLFHPPFLAAVVWPLAGMAHSP
ncbi:MAG TPA: membrane bound O-acyl transferase family-domain-containing protein [Myxococcota bacterium]|jgi:alginate O-acetyltransferase complex protein AlgI|nr:membrane bound O-acyl transferase family-domain-containing protein [Myxococcota bacterium]